MGIIQHGDEFHKSSGGVYVDVTKYGAKGDDSTDDTSAIQAAIDATPAYGTVVFPIGTYKITAALVRSTTPIRLLGVGTMYGGSVIHQVNTNTSGVTFTYAWDTDAGDHEDASIVENLRILGPTGNASGYGVYSKSSVQLYQSSVSGFYYGVYVDNTAFWTWLENCLFEHADHSALYLNGSHNTTVFNCRLWKSTYGLFAVHSGGDEERLSIENCNVEQNGNAGLLIDGVRAVLVKSCYFESRVTNAPDISLGLNYVTKDVTLIGNWHTHYPGAAVFHVDCNNVTGMTIVGGTYNDSDAGGGDFRWTANSSKVVIVNAEYHTLSGTPADTVIVNSSTGASGPAGNDLSGTYPNPTVARINGTTVGASPGVAGLVLTSTGATSSAWQAITFPSVSIEMLVGEDGTAPPLMLTSEDQTDYLWTD